jgi:uncharacterized membrane protein
MTASRSAPTQPDIEARINVAAHRIVQFVSRHWLALANSAFGLYLTLALLAPLLANGTFGWLSKTIYTGFRFICHQLPSHSYFISGQQLACCQRCTAIYGSFFIGGFLFWAVRDYLPPLRFRNYIFLCIPIAVDALSQAVGLRESSWELRTLTGSLFALASIWLAYPRFHPVMSELTSSLTVSPQRSDVVIQT